MYHLNYVLFSIFVLLQNDDNKSKFHAQNVTPESETDNSIFHNVIMISTYHKLECNSDCIESFPLSVSLVSNMYFHIWPRVINHTTALPF